MPRDDFWRLNLDAVDDHAAQRWDMHLANDIIDFLADSEPY